MRSTETHPALAPWPTMVGRAVNVVRDGERLNGVVRYEDFAGRVPRAIHVAIVMDDGRESDLLSPFKFSFARRRWERAYWNVRTARYNFSVHKAHLEY